jgi:hypothetical protein
MHPIVEQKKAELNRKAEQYKEEFITGYSETINNPGSVIKLGLLSGGLILNSFFPDKKESRDQSVSAKPDTGPGQDDFEDKGLEWQFKAEYKEKLVLVLLEMLRQILLLLTEKLVPAHDDPDLR